MLFFYACDNNIMQLLIGNTTHLILLFYQLHTNGLPRTTDLVISRHFSYYYYIKIIIQNISQ